MNLAGATGFNHKHDTITDRKTGKGMILQKHSSLHKPHGFTIVELLIVIVVIGILAAITIVAFNGVQERGKVSRAQSDLRNLSQAIQTARINTNQNLVQITGQNDARATKSAADAAIDSIAAASGVNLTALKNGDPWGNYYRIDPNEREASPTDCRLDDLRAHNRTEPALIMQIPLYQNC